MCTLTTFDVAKMAPMEVLVFRGLVYSAVITAANKEPILEASQFRWCHIWYEGGTAVGPLCAGPVGGHALRPSCPPFHKRGLSALRTAWLPTLGTAR